MVPLSGPVNRRLRAYRLKRNRLRLLVDIFGRNDWLLVAGPCTWHETFKWVSYTGKPWPKQDSTPCYRPTNRINRGALLYEELNLLLSLTDSALKSEGLQS